MAVFDGLAPSRSPALSYTTDLPTFRGLMNGQKPLAKAGTTVKVDVGSWTPPKSLAPIEPTGSLYTRRLALSYDACG